MKREQKRKVGRPANPNRPAQQKARRFYPLEKTPLTETLMIQAHIVYIAKHGKIASDAEILREALREYGKD